MPTGAFARPSSRSSSTPTRSQSTRGAPKRRADAGEGRRDRAGRRRPGTGARRRRRPQREAPAFHAPLQRAQRPRPDGCHRPHPPRSERQRPAADRPARARGEAVRSASRPWRRRRRPFDSWPGVQARQAEVEKALGTAREQAAELRGANDGLRKEMNDLSRRSTRSSRADLPDLPQPARPARARTPDRRSTRPRARPSGPIRPRTRPAPGSLTASSRSTSRPQAARRPRPAACRAPSGAWSPPSTPSKPPAPPPAKSRPPARRSLGWKTCSAAAPTPRPRRHSLAKIEAELDALSYDEATHRRLKKELAGLADYEALARELAAARQAIDLREDALRQARESLASWQERLKDEQTHLADVRQEIQACRPCATARPPPSAP